MIPLKQSTRRTLWGAKLRRRWGVAARHKAAVSFAGKRSLAQSIKRGYGVKAVHGMRPKMPRWVAKRPAASQGVQRPMAQPRLMSGRPGATMKPKVKPKFSAIKRPTSFGRVGFFRMGF